ncbi:hypothetical protein C6A85_14605, partial [Mycobacterium sp. ITM-2017-0098]
MPGRVRTGRGVEITNRRDTGTHRKTAQQWPDRRVLEDQLAVLTWLGAAVMLAFGFIPGLFAPEEHSLFGGELVFKYSPIW